MEFFLNNVVDNFVLETTTSRVLLLKNNGWDWGCFLGNYSQFHECTSGRLKASGSRFTSARVPGLFFLGFFWRIIVGIGMFSWATTRDFRMKNYFQLKKYYENCFCHWNPHGNPHVHLDYHLRDRPWNDYIKIRIVFTEFFHQFPKLFYCFRVFQTLEIVIISKWFTVGSAISSSASYTGQTQITSS